MPDPVTAVTTGGAAVVGGMASQSASSSARSNRRAAENQAEATVEAARIQTEQAEAASLRQEGIARDQLAFQKDLYEDWEQVYGPMKQNLSNFYSGLTSENFASSGLAQIKKNYDQIEEQFQRTFAQQGITSGAQAMAFHQQSLQEAEAKAAVRQAAPLQVAQAQTEFASKPISPNTSGMSAAYGNLQNTLGSQANLAMQHSGAIMQQGQFAVGQFNNAANRQSAIAGQANAAVGQAIVGGVSAYAQNQQLQQLQQTQQTQMLKDQWSN